MYKFDTAGKTEIYNHGLTLDEIKAIIGVWEKTYQALGIKESELQPRGIKTFKEFIWWTRLGAGQTY